MAISFQNENCCAKWCSCSRIYRRMKKDLLLVLIIIGAALGFFIGALVNSPVNAIADPEERRQTIIMLIGFPGELLMSMLQMVILPLIVASLITALATLDSAASGKVGRRAMLFYLTTTLSAAILGMALVSIIQPGKSDRPDGEKTTSTPYRILDSFLDLIRSLFPSNLVEATLRQKKTAYTSVQAKYDKYNTTVDVSKLPINETITIFSNGTHNITTVSRLVYPASETVPSGTRMNPGMNVLGIAFFSIIFGYVLGKMGEKGQVMKDFFKILNDIIMKIVFIIMWYAPIGVCSLIATRVAAMDDIPKALNMLALFIVTVLSGLTIHGMIVLPLMYLVVTRKNPYHYMAGMRDALITAFGISSSSATLPTTIRCAEENNKIDSRISKFVLPLGATINMDGGALYEAISAIFIAQLSNIDLSPVMFVATCITATAVSIGAAGIPSAGNVTTIIVLQAVNLPMENIGLLMAVDWFLDRFRTTVNVLGDSIGTGIVAHLSRDDLTMVDHYPVGQDDYVIDKDGLMDNNHEENIVMTTM